MESKRNTISLINKTHLGCSILSFSTTSSSFFLFLFFFSICTLLSTPSGSTITCLDSSRCPMSAKADINLQESKEVRIRESMAFEGKTDVQMGWARRFLGGPGSSPPQCTSKCGNCAPCSPVHVPVPPGTAVPAEYYPEAWRCKCGNKLYLP